jgi:exonuclease III
METNVTNYELICLTETKCHPKQFVKIAKAKAKFTSFFAKLGLQG